MPGTLVSNPELKVSIIPGSELADAYTVKPVLNRLPRPRFDGAAFTVPLRDLIAGEEQTLVFRIGVPARPTGKATLLRFSLRSEEHTSELQSLAYLVCRLLLEKKKKNLTQTQ